MDSFAPLWALLVFSGLQSQTLLSWLAGRQFGGRASSWAMILRPLAYRPFLFQGESFLCIISLSFTSEAFNFSILPRSLRTLVLKSLYKKSFLGF